MLRIKIKFVSNCAQYEVIILFKLYPLPRYCSHLRYVQLRPSHKSGRFCRLLNDAIQSKRLYRNLFEIFYVIASRYLLTYILYLVGFYDVLLTEMWSWWSAFWHPYLQTLLLVLVMCDDAQDLKNQFIKYEYQKRIQLIADLSCAVR